MKRRSHRIQLPPNPRTPVVGWALSMALPGLGLIYAGRNIEALGAFVACFAIGAGVVLAGLHPFIYAAAHVAQAAYSWSRAGDANTAEAGELYRRRKAARRRRKTAAPDDEPGA